MNMSTKKYLILIISTAFVVLATFWAGGYIASNQVNTTVNRVQANLAFRHLKAYEEIRDHLNSDCKLKAIAKLDFLIEEQKMLMAEYLQSTDDAEYKKYVSLREPSLVDELREYQVNWNKEIVMPECQEGKKRGGDN